MTEKMIELPDGSWVRPSQIRELRPLPPSVGYDGTKHRARIVVILASGAHVIIDQPAFDEAKAEAARIAALCANA